MNEYTTGRRLPKWNRDQPPLSIDDPAVVVCRRGDNYSGPPRVTQNYGKEIGG